ncbi:chloride channel protein [Deinococcus sp. KNUC1210]|uniref:chloride channel protein n=1 Tax=Deinococcus sp. KNUC1210 TaxID=2917691 RepID=UPI001EEFE3C0|nr:chloride channel protein [Deinococcus sp. KNUC1210]ULH16254.1 chloride channel protein [Deinococcus sp. KNUC1210]
MRSPLPRTILTRLETGRLVLYSLLAGGLVGLVGTGWREVLDMVLTLGAWVLGYRPPGAAGEGGLLMAFGDTLPYALLLLPICGALYALLMRSRLSDPLNAVVAGYHARGDWKDPLTQARGLVGTVLGQASGLLVGRDSSFIALGSMCALLLSRVARIDAGERRVLTLACVAAAIGLVLHAPLAAAVLMAEVLYRRFEFEFEVLMPCVLAAVCASAVSGLMVGFEPLFSLPGDLTPSAGQLPLYLLLAGAVTLLSWILAQVTTVISQVFERPAFQRGWLARWPLRVLLGAVFGLITAAIAVYSTPTILGGGSGWLQLGVSGFLGSEAGGMAAWRWLLMALGAQLAFGGGVVVSAATGGLLGVGLASALGGFGLNLDASVSALIGAATCLTVTLNIPVAAALLAVTWGGDALLPVALASTGLAHTLSGEASLLSGQVSRRAQSRVHAPTAGTVLGRIASPLRPLTTVSLPASALAAGTLAAEAGDGDSAARLLLTGTASAQSAAPQARQLYRQEVPRSWLGARVGVLTLPERMELVGVVQNGQARLSQAGLRLNAGDELLLLATPSEFQNWQQSLRVPG